MQRRKVCFHCLFYVISSASTNVWKSEFLCFHVHMEVKSPPLLCQGENSFLFVFALDCVFVFDLWQRENNSFFPGMILFAGTLQRGRSGMILNYFVMIMRIFCCQDTTTGRGWCSTATDKSGYHESGKGSWGECNLLTSAGFSSRSGHNCNFSVSSGLLLFLQCTPSSASASK